MRPRAAKKLPPEWRQLFFDVLLVSVLALLIRHAAASLAGRLAGGLALAAAAVLRTVTHAAGFERFDSFHSRYLPFFVRFDC